jgi:hypothetical protein
VIEKPRRYLRLAFNTFYRIDHIYLVLQEFKRTYKGNFAILEFGTSDGYAFTKMLYATKYLGMEDQVTVHTFDSFEGLPAPAEETDVDLVADDSFVVGEYRGRYEELQRYCSQKYKNFQIHKGYFDQTLTPEFLRTLETQRPILIWIDCDYYSSTRIVFERLINYIPNGCVIYFDDYNTNFGSRFTGQARFVYEINSGLFGNDIELVLDRKLSLDSQGIYRFIQFKSGLRYELLTRENVSNRVHYRTNDSPLP